MIQNVTILPKKPPLWQENDWKNHLKESISDPIELLDLLGLSVTDLPYAIDTRSEFAQRVPRPFVDLMEKGNPFDPLLLQVLPRMTEREVVEGFSKDPLQEQNSVLPGLLHKYRSRVLFMLATHCAVNCRYCFRREFPYSENRASKADWQQLSDYLKLHPDVNEVIISGGDPLAVSDSYLADFVSFIESIPQIIRLRIHTRLPVVIPQRITSQLLALKQKSRLQMVMVLHINHPNEVSDDLKVAAKLLSEQGYQLFNQSVLLKSVNDNAKVLAELSEKLFAHRIQPYYLHLLDPIQGSHMYDLTSKQALTIMAELQKSLAGFLVPKLVREEAKVPHKTLINLIN